MEKTMRVMQVAHAGGPFELVERPLPEPGEGQVRLKVEACGVCASDGITKEGYMPIDYPRVPGHEVAGQVDAIGTGVTQWQVGDRVGIGFHGGHCFVCPACRSGDFVNCVNLKSTGISFDGGYAEYMVAPQDALARIPDELEATLAAPLMCAGMTTFNVLRHSGVQPGDLVAVLGLGGLGHLAVQFAAKAGYKTVVIARGAGREKVARDLGANFYIDNTATNAGEELQKLGGAKVILATAPSSQAIEEVVSGLAANGTLMLLAVPNAPLAISATELLFGRKKVQGWYSGHAKDIEETMAFSVLSRIRPKVEIYPLKQADQAYASMNTGKANFRAVIKM